MSTQLNRNSVKLKFNIGSLMSGRVVKTCKASVLKPEEFSGVKGTLKEIKQWCNTRLTVKGVDYAAKTITLGHVTDYSTRLVTWPISALDQEFGVVII